MSMTADTPFWPPVLTKLMRGEELTADEAGGALSTILEGRATPAQIAGFAVALRAKGETPAEMAALVRTMLAYADRVEVAGPLLDTCGTGGDRSCSINVSTLAALVAAGAGARVAKHGNRSATSACGSADLLETLGVAVELGPAGVARCIDEVGIGFCFAPRYHKALRHAGPVRRELGVPTTFNFLGPLANPAGARRQTIGVGDAAMAERMVATLVELGTERALVFFGHDGLDELTTTTTSAVWEIADAEVHYSNFDPTELGIPLAAPEDLVGGDPDTNARLARAILDGEAGPHRDIVVLNSAAALVAAGLAGDLAEGVRRRPGLAGRRTGRRRPRGPRQGQPGSGREGSRLMASGLQCPGCGHVHPSGLPEIARGDATFRCYGCYRTLSIPEGWTGRPAPRPASAPVATVDAPPGAGSRDARTARLAGRRNVRTDADGGGEATQMVPHGRGGRRRRRLTGPQLAGRRRHGRVGGRRRHRRPRGGRRGRGPHRRRRDRTAGWRAPAGRAPERPPPRWAGWRPGVPAGPSRRASGLSCGRPPSVPACSSPPSCSRRSACSASTRPSISSPERAPHASGSSW